VQLARLESGLGPQLPGLVPEPGLFRHLASVLEDGHGLFLQASALSEALDAPGVGGHIHLLGHLAILVPDLAGAELACGVTGLKPDLARLVVVLHQACKGRFVPGLVDQPASLLHFFRRGRALGQNGSGAGQDQPQAQDCKSRKC